MNEHVPPSPTNTTPARALEPAVDVFESPESMLLLVDLPGVAKAALEVQVHGQALSIKASKTGVAYERSFRLPDSVDQAKIHVALANGVARIELPKQERARPQRIPVN